MGKTKQLKREKIYDSFKDIYLPELLSKKILIYEDKEHKFFNFTTRTYGIFNYFPMCDKIQFHSENKWKDNGLEWIIEYLL